MPDLRRTTRNVKIALAAMAAADLIAIGIYFSPLIGSPQSRREQLDQLWATLQAKTREVEPLRGLDKKIPIAHQQIEDFYRNRLPDEESEISEQIGKVAQQSGVRIGNVKFAAKETDSVGLQRVEISGDFSGDYLQLVRFINSLERDQLFFLINSVGLGGEQGGQVKLELKMETYLKSRTGAA
jgi:type IV pilus assembly protein PilO